jgi:hypothetical protein
MLNTYIKNRGHTKTIIHSNNQNKINEIDWDADYDGDNAKIKLFTNTDGKKKQFKIELDSDDLANLLNIPSVNMPLHKRLKIDFHRKNPTPKIIQIELPNTKTSTDNLLSSITDSDEIPQLTETPQLTEIPQLTETPQLTEIPELLSFSQENQPENISNFLSSSLPDNHQFIIPVTIQHPNHKTKRRHRRKYKPHKTYRIYKVHKKSRSKSRSSKSRSSKSRSSKSSSY